MDGDITLRWDRATAEDLYATLREVGEHVAAGTPIHPPGREEVERVAQFLADLGHALGRKCTPYCRHLG